MTDRHPTSLDARGRAAGSALRVTAELRPLAATRPGVVRHRTWVRPVALLAVTAALLALLFVVARREDDAVDRDSSGLQYVIGDLPAGWSVESVKDAGVDMWGDAAQDAVALYGTAGDPTAPTIHLYLPPSEVSYDVSMLIGTTEVRHFEIDGRASGCGSTAFGAPMTRCIAALAGGGVVVTAAHLTFEQLVPVLQALVLADGMPTLDPAALPAGMVLLRSGDTKHESAMKPGGGNTADVSHVLYAGPGGATQFLTTGWADQHELAAAFNDSMHAVQVGAVTGFAGVGDGPGLVRVVWTHDGRSFALTATATEAEAVALAASVRPASAIEWANLQPNPDSTTTAPDRTSPDTTTTAPDDTLVDSPPATLDPSVDTITDVRVQLTIGGTTADDLRLSSALPDGTFGEIEVVILGTNLLFRGDNSGMGIDISQWEEPYAQEMGDQAGYFVITTDRTYATLRVTRSNGERYIMDITEIPDHPGIYAAVIGVPTGEMVSFELVDAKGTTLLGTP